MSEYRNYQNRNGQAKRYTGAPYIRGNVVPKPEYMPQERRNNAPARAKKPQTRRYALTGKYMLFLVIASVAVVAICVIYLNLRAQINVQQQEIAAMESQVAAMKEQNDTRYNLINESINLETVRERAVNDLGMTYASESQIIPYTQPQGDYIAQKSAIAAD